MEFNDFNEYVMIASRLKDFSMPFKGLMENEFTRLSTFSVDAEGSSHHLKLDLENEYVRLKSRGGRGASPDYAVNPSGVVSGDVQQGLEIRDGSLGDGPWTELVDAEERGLWLSKKFKRVALRASKNKDMSVWFDENARQVVVHNGESGGKVQIYATGDVEIVAGGNLYVTAQREMHFRAEQNIRFQAGGAILDLDKSFKLLTNATFNAPLHRGFFCNVQPGPGAGCTPDPPSDVKRAVAEAVPKLAPEDRGKTYNVPSAVPDVEIEHPRTKE
jgi:hypothetical protein